ncbi:polyamine-modulated factor 1-like [Styela clava]
MDAESEEKEESSRYECLDKCLSNFVRSLREKPGSCKRMAKSFPELYWENPAALKLISDAFGDRYTSMLKQSIEELFKTCSVKDKLDELGQCVGNVDCSWRPSGDPEKDLRAHIALTDHKEVIKLQEELEKEEAEIASLRDTLNHKDKAIERKMLHIHALTEECVSSSQLARANADNLNLLFENKRKKMKN